MVEEEQQSNLDVTIFSKSKKHQNALVDHSVIPDAYIRDLSLPFFFTTKPIAVLAAFETAERAKRLRLHVCFSVPEPTLALRCMLIPKTSKTGVD